MHAHRPPACPATHRPAASVYFVPRRLDHRRTSPPLSPSPPEDTKVADALPPRQPPCLPPRSPPQPRRAAARFAIAVRPPNFTHFLRVAKLASAPVTPAPPRRSLPRRTVTSRQSTAMPKPPTLCSAFSHNATVRDVTNIISLTPRRPRPRPTLTGAPRTSNSAPHVSPIVNHRPAASAPPLHASRSSPSPPEAPRLVLAAASSGLGRSHSRVPVSGISTRHRCIPATASFTQLSPLGYRHANTVASSDSCVPPLPSPLQQRRYSSRMYQQNTHGRAQELRCSSPASPNPRLSGRPTMPHPAYLAKASITASVFRTIQPSATNARRPATHRRHAPELAPSTVTAASFLVETSPMDAPQSAPAPRSASIQPRRMHATHHPRRHAAHSCHPRKQGASRMTLPHHH